MTDHIPNDLSHLSEEEFHSLCPQGEHAPGPEPLSPAAQAVLIAEAKSRCLREEHDCHPDDSDWNGCYICVHRRGLAAALRAAVVQVAPVSTNARQMKIRDELLAIANELEGMSN
jgi:hypothetical protein